jgi:hypothetical protein
MTPLSAFLLGIVTGALLLSGVAIALFVAFCWQAQPMDEECQ